MKSRLSEQTGGFYVMMMGRQKNGERTEDHEKSADHGKKDRPV